MNTQDGNAGGFVAGCFLGLLFVATVWCVIDFVVALLSTWPGRLAFVLLALCGWGISRSWKKFDSEWKGGRK